jgi:hypothetical protein
MKVKGKYTNATIIKENDIYHVQISFTTRLPNRATVKYQAPAPYDTRQSKPGSALPFPNPETAYSGNHPNKGMAEVIGNNIKFRLLRPNSYYINAGTTFVPPHIYLRFGKDFAQEDIIMIPYVMPFRALTHHKERVDADFYKAPNNLQQRSQWQILQQNQQPSEEVFYKNVADEGFFWGTKPRQ